VTVSPRAWERYFATLREISPRFASAILRRGAAAEDLLAVEAAVGQELAADLRALFSSCGGSAGPLLFADEVEGPKWRLLSPEEALTGWLESKRPSDGFPFADAATGSMRWFLAVGFSDDRPIVFSFDAEAPEDPTRIADSIDALFAAELVRLSAGEICVVGFERDHPPELMSRRDFAALGEGAHVLPKSRTGTTRPDVEPTEEAARFLVVLIERGWIRVVRPPSRQFLSEIANQLRRRTAKSDRAARLIERLSAEPAVVVGALRSKDLMEFLERW
jgi:hypothetical protein